MSFQPLLIITKMIGDVYKSSNGQEAGYFCVMKIEKGQVYHSPLFWNNDIMIFKLSIAGFVNRYDKVEYQLPNNLIQARYDHELMKRRIKIAHK